MGIRNQSSALFILICLKKKKPWKSCFCVFFWMERHWLLRSRGLARNGLNFEHKRRGPLRDTGPPSKMNSFIQKNYGLCLKWTKLWIQRRGSLQKCGPSQKNNKLSPFFGKQTQEGPAYGILVQMLLFLFTQERIPSHPDIWNFVII